MTDDVASYPLAWPDGWPRTPEGKRESGDHFKQAEDIYDRGQHWKRQAHVRVSTARGKLRAELARMKGISQVVVSSNLSPRSESGRGGIADPGVAVWFKLLGRGMVMAVDRYATVAANMRSVGLAIEALRQLERHGGGVMMERAFTGFAALPPPPSAWTVLGLEPGASASAIEAAFRRLALQHHPDRGGSNAKMAELNKARDDAMKGMAV